MTIKIWKSFSCNNSSSYHLVARFGDPKAASETATELAAFFKTHAEQMDQVMEANDYEWPDDPPPAAQALGEKYGFQWKEILGWGDEGLVGDEPHVIAEDGVLALYHDYCGGFGKEIAAYLKARGAVAVDKEDTGPLTLSVLFRYPGGNRNLDKALAALFAQIEGESRRVDPLKTPWENVRDSYGSAAFYRDRRTVAMVIPTDPRALPELRSWLAKHGIGSPSLRIGELGDEAKFAAIAGAKCTACDGALELWHPRLDDIHHEQVACVACGGMYDVTTYVELAKRRAAKEKRAVAAAAKAAAATAAAKPAKPAAKKPAAKNPAKTAKKVAKKPAKQPAKQPAKKAKR